MALTRERLYKYNQAICGIPRAGQGNGMAEHITFIFEGRRAAEGQLDLYDAAVSMYGAARVFQILGHYYATGKIISKAPSSEVPVFLLPPEQGSFRETLIVGVIVGIVAAPFGVFSEMVFRRWFPEENPQMRQVIELLKEQNQLLRGQHDLPREPADQERHHEHEMNDFMQEHHNELQVLRSILANSTKDMFRPVGRSADYLAITHGRERAPIAALDVDGVRRLESETIDDEVSEVVGVVNSFSRGSKTGVVFSEQLQRGVLFEYQHAGPLARGDVFSWSQFSGRPIQMTGRYVRWFDRSIKRFIVYEVQRLAE